MWIDPTTSDIARTHSEVRALRPNWGGPNIIDDTMIADLGFAEVRITAPTYNPLTQEAIAKPLPEMVDDTWTQVWSVTDLSAADQAKKLADVRAARWQEIAQFRDTREEQGFKLGAHWFHSDPKSQTKYLGLKDKARDVLTAGGALTDTIKEQGQVIPWHTMDNADVPMTGQLAFDLVAAVATLQATVFAVAKGHRAAMEAATRPDLYDFSAGWPAIYKA